MASSAQPRLLDAPLAGLYGVPLAHANELLLAFGHRLGPCRRPFGSESFVLEVGGSPVSVAVSASIVNGPVAGLSRQEVVELARLASCAPWANRVMLRLWRQVCAPGWHYWPVKAAVSYSLNAEHRGDLYRFDGWTRVSTTRGSMGGGGWTRPRAATDATAGKKTLWIWRYQQEPSRGV